MSLDLNNGIISSEGHQANDYSLRDAEHHTLIDWGQQKLNPVLPAMNKILIGQPVVVEQSVIGILSGGHILITGAPGLGKTNLFSNMSAILGLAYNRVQGVPDLLSADILGMSVLDKTPDGKTELTFRPGPVFTDLFLFDEINRAPPKLKAALLQAMGEGAVTIDGKSYPLSKAFRLFATRNPIEQDGTYPMSEAEIDRFLMNITIDNTDLRAEREIAEKVTGSSLEYVRQLIRCRDNGKDILKGEGGNNEVKVEAVTNPTELFIIQELVKTLPIEKRIFDSILKIVRALRADNINADKEVEEYVALSPGPRAQHAFIKAVKARAFLHGRVSPDVSDIHALAEPVIAHRMALKPTAHMQGVTSEELIDRTVKKVLG